MSAGEGPVSAGAGWPGLAALMGCSPSGDEVASTGRSGGVVQFRQRLHVAAQVADLDARVICENP